MAGTGTEGFSGDGGAATSANLRSPRGIVLDSSDNLYIADFDNHRIRKVDTNGNISTVAGTGTEGFSGDGGAATSAKLSSPAGVALDSSGYLYIADFDNHRIRKVDTNGNISTVAGTGDLGFAGDGGAATSANLFHPWGIALDSSDNLYIADRDNDRIRKVDTNGNISTVAGNGDSAFSGDGGLAVNAALYHPQGIAFDSSGDLYIADSENHRIRKVDTNGNISTVVGTGTHGSAGDGGAATSAELYLPSGVALDSSGNLYIAGYGSNRTRMVGGE